MGEAEAKRSTQNVFHYTDRPGWNSIRSQKVWRFQVSQPKDPDRPPGIYFTDIEPTADNLRTLHKRLRVPKAKQEYTFWFIGLDGLVQLFGGRGRDKRIFYSLLNYKVVESRQRYEGETRPLLEDVT